MCVSVCVCTLLHQVYKEAWHSVARLYEAGCQWASIVGLRPGPGEGKTELPEQFCRERVHHYGRLSALGTLDMTLTCDA